MPQTNGNADDTANGTHPDDVKANADVNTDYLIVGTGPAGASLACFLAQNGECHLFFSAVAPDATS
jgi:NADPH-dependent 2,4-dienoyl-CoA reductase/sulfur reductase-like enzyme